MDEAPKRLRDFCVSDLRLLPIWNLAWIADLSLSLGVAINLSTVTHAKVRLQTVADTASHSGAVDLSANTAVSVNAVMSYVTTNISAYPDVPTNVDIIPG